MVGITGARPVNVEHPIAFGREDRDENVVGVEQAKKNRAVDAPECSTTLRMPIARTPSRRNRSLAARRNCWRGARQGRWPVFTSVAPANSIAGIDKVTDLLVTFKSVIGPLF